MPHTTVAGLAKASERKAKAALSLIDAEYQSLPIKPFLSTKASPGELLLQLSKGDPTVNPRSQVELVRKRTAKRIQDAKAPLAAALEVCAYLRSAADHVESGSSLPNPPDLVPEHVHAAAKAARAGTLAGILDPTEITTKLRNSAARAATDITEHKKMFRRFESAAGVARIRGAAGYYEKCSMNIPANALFERADKFAEIHRKQFGKPPIKKGSRHGR